MVARAHATGWGQCSGVKVVVAQGGGGCGDVTFQPHAILPTHVGMLQDLNHTQDMPNEAETHLWTHREDDKEMICAMLDTLEDTEEPEEAKEDLEDAKHLYRMVMSNPYD